MVNNNNNTKKERYRNRFISRKIHTKKDREGDLIPREKRKMIFRKKININSKIKRNSPVEINLVNMISI